MFNRNNKHFFIRRRYPKEAINLRHTLDERFRKYMAEYFTEECYIEVIEAYPYNHDMKFDVTFKRAPSNPKLTNAIIDNIVTLIMSDVKLEGETSFRETQRKLLSERLAKYRNP